MIKLYHGTPYPHEVLKHGILPNHRKPHEGSLDGYVYLTNEPRMAATFGVVIEATLPEEIALYHDPEWGSGLVHPGPISPTYLEPCPCVESELDMSVVSEGEKMEVTPLPSYWTEDANLEKVEPKRLNG